MPTEINRKYRDRVQKRLLESAEVKKKVADECVEQILAATQLIINTFESGGKVMICGNGGSASDSQHMAGEFICALNKDFNRPGLPAIALTTDTSILTAYANDFSFDGVFERQVQALGKPNDLLIGISTSGNSKNVISAFKTAQEIGVKTISMCGEGGNLAEMSDLAISIPNPNTQYIQESLLSVEHIICELVEDHLFNTKKDKI